MSALGNVYDTPPPVYNKCTKTFRNVMEKKISPITTVLGRSAAGPHFMYLLRVQNIFIFYYPVIGPRIKHQLFQGYRKLDHIFAYS